MATYIIGDLQGCFSSFMSLLQKIQFDPSRDQVWIAGDLINRGHDSLATLRFIYQHRQSIFTVLGNHDLHMLNAYYLRKPLKKGDTFHDIMLAPDANTMLSWLIEQPLAHYFEHFNVFLSHAGLYPAWTHEQALSFASEVQEQLCQKDKIITLFNEMYGNTPDYWDDNHKGMDRYRFIMNAMTRMRFLYSDLRLDFKHKARIEDAPQELSPWFAHRVQLPGTTHIAFGHWASLAGTAPNHTNGNKNIFALDTGCVWGGTLTALKLETMELFSICN
ncbi:MAG: diadenosine tetraphosphatase [Gammaproteobacteria bacterium]|nr:diadenosine tetraphosphatase [Gammaproteobacteria bacterium]HBF08912.1 diadenosine tetraphosphatase [Gammaproteobacteria bacterium]|tara:strand:+ start:1258 stop:2082 length:825 start_codon:yes stop_codon:yes gene_type:complete